MADDTPLLVAHRDMGPGFTHVDRLDCGCCPTVVEIDDGTTAEQVQRAVQQNERPQ